MYKKSLFHLLPLLLLMLGYWYFNTRPGLALYPNDSYRFHIYSDAKKGGNSLVTQDKGKDSVTFKLSLKSGYKNPYVGFTYNLPPTRQGEKKYQRYFDISGYDEVRLKLSSKNLKTMMFSINTLEPGITDSTKASSFRHNQQEIPLLSGKKEYVLRLKNASTPHWWFRNLGISEHEIGKTRWDLAYNLNFFGFNDLDGEINEVTVYSVILKKSYKLILIGLFLLVLAYYLVFILFYILKKNKNKSKEIVVSYVQRTVENKIPQEQESIVKYIGEYYHNSKLAITDISKALGYQQNSISKILSQEVGMTFKEYLNSLRIEEASRLLLSSESSISEIAYLVGFNSPNSFNRVFKLKQGLSPSEYRNKNFN